MRFTLQLPTDRVAEGEEFVSAETIAEMARAAERAGFDAAFLTDHPAPEDRWLRSGGHQALDPFVALSFVAAATARLRVQTHVLVAAYRNPFLAAKAIATLDVLSRGRVIVGLAAGYLEPEFAALGVDYAERNELTDEAIVAMKRIWGGDSPSLEGRHFRRRPHRAAAAGPAPPPAALDRRQQPARDAACRGARRRLAAVPGARAHGDASTPRRWRARPTSPPRSATCAS